MFIANPELDEEHFQTLLTRVTDLITQNGGEVLSAEPWGRRRLAYPIRHFHDGLYSLIRFKLHPDKIGEVERPLRLTEDVLRYIMVKFEEKDLRRLAAMQTRMAATTSPEAAGVPPEPAMMSEPTEEEVSAEPIAEEPSV